MVDIVPLQQLLAKLQRIGATIHKQDVSHLFVATEFDYVNHRGVQESRAAHFEKLTFGSNEYHPEPQWLVEGWDLSRGARRAFAINDITFDKEA